jgi:RNA polymerase sigma-70 factor (ECF subfamily)
MSSDQNIRPGNEEFSLAALQAGDRAEFSRLVDTYSGKIYRLALSMLNQPQDAEDILQETFIKAFRHLKGFDGRSKLSTWLYRIATNEALMVLRRQRAHDEAGFRQTSIDEPLETLEGDQEPIQIVDWCCLPEEELVSVESRQYLEKAVENLPYSLRVVFLLRDIEGLSTQETADILNLSETAVKTRLSRARMNLREQLSAYFGEWTNREKRIERQVYGNA